MSFVFNRTLEKLKKNALDTAKRVIGVLTRFAVITSKTFLTGILNILVEFKGKVLLAGIVSLLISVALAITPTYNFKPIIDEISLVSAIFEGAGFVNEDCAVAKEASKWITAVKGAKTKDGYECEVLLSKDNIDMFVAISRYAGAFLVIASVLAFGKRRDESDVKKG